jgi:hypothetical protein
MEEMVSYAVSESKNVEIRKLLRKKVPPEVLVESLPDELFDKLMEVLRQPQVKEILSHRTLQRPAWERRLLF